MRLIRLATLGTLVLFGPGLAAAQSSVSPSAADPAAITPLVDHHAHIHSPAYAESSFPPILPTVELPPYISRLVTGLGNGTGVESDFQALFAEDSISIKSDMNNWVLGRKEVAGFWGAVFPEGIKIAPVHYRENDNIAYLMGYVANPAGAESQPRFLGTTILIFEKGEDRQWRIANMSTRGGSPRLPLPVTAEQYLEELDAAGIQRGNILSIAFVMGGAPDLLPGEAARVRAENDWNGQQATRYPTRLTAFCSLNPLKDYALEEVANCGADPAIKGLKFHFADSGVDLRNPQHLAKVRAVFQAANQHRLAITAHIMTREKDYDGRATATAFLNELLPVVPDVPVQIAHMTGDSFFGPQPQAGFAVFADAIVAQDPRTARLYFDASVGRDQAADNLQILASAMRRVGFDRILFGSDRHAPNNLPPAASWRVWREKLPLSDDEFRDIADNVVVFRD